MLNSCCWFTYVQVFKLVELFESVSTERVKATRQSPITHPSASVYHKEKVLATRYFLYNFGSLPQHSA